MDEPVPDWFYQAVSQGLAAMVVLHLPGAPGHETIAYTEQVWVEVLWSANINWQSDLDATRLRAAFRRLPLETDRWPGPKALLQWLPPRPQRKKLAAPVMTTEQRARVGDLIHKLRAKLKHADE